MHMWNILRIRNSWNAFWHSVQNLLPPCFLSKNTKPKTCRALVLSVVLYGYETWSHTLREEHRLRMFERGKYLGLKGREWQGPGECCIMRSIILCTAHQRVWGWSNKGWWDWWHTLLLWEEGEIYTGFWWGIMKEREHLHQLGLYSMMILKWVFKYCSNRVWNGLNWLKVGTSDGLLCTL